MSTHRVTVVIGASDFERLCENSANWPDFQDEAGIRLEGKYQFPLRQWKRVYWVGGNYASVIFARSFLAAEGFDCDVLFDAAVYPSGESLGWVILTDYEGER